MRFNTVILNDLNREVETIEKLHNRIKLKDKIKQVKNPMAVAKMSGLLRFAMTYENKNMNQIETFKKLTK